MNILIIGGGVAAFEAALAAAENPVCKVTVCSAETVPPYRRPALSRMVAEEVSDTAFYFKQPDFYKEHNIELKLNKRAVAINRENSTARERSSAIQESISPAAAQARKIRLRISSGSNGSVVVSE